MKKILWCVFSLMLIQILLSANAEALPAFARKHNAACSMCHAVYPKLTTFGRAFKENGYRMPDDDLGWKDTLTVVPVAGRVTWTHSSLGPDTDRFSFGLFQPIAAGALGSWISFWADRVFFATDDDFEDVGTENAWIRVDDILRSLRPDLLNVRAGKFELDLPFTQTRTYNLFPYRPYFITTGIEDFNFGDAEEGFEVSGNPTPEMRYSLAIVEGFNNAPGHEEDFDADLYFRISQTFDVTHRVGFFLYRGENTLAQFPGAPEFENTITRLGGDFDLYGLRGDLNVYGLYLWGRNSNPIGPGAADPERNFSGGFVQADGRLRDWLTLTSRYSLERVDRDDGGSAENFQSLVLGAQAWFLDRLKVAFEYRFQDKDRLDWGTLSFDLVL